MLFDLPKEQSSIIKVFGIGGGGCNAVNHMFRQGIKDVNFVICNTDAQALESSPVPNRIQLGPELTKGRGAGNHPEMGQAATLESMEEIRTLLEANTEMVFITAGMGGGTGTGGAPVVSRIARDMGVLTVGIVTLPFSFEGKKRVAQAKQGIEELKEHVDSIIVIVNDKIREVYGNLGFSEAFARADDILTTAARGIAEIITITGYVNVDFEDVKTVLRDSGVAIMGTGVATGEHRAIEAVESALNSPLLNDTDIRGARHVLLNITSGQQEVLMDEISEITEYVQEAAGMEADIIWGNCHDENMGEELSVTVIATGFEVDQRPAAKSGKKQQVVHSLTDEKPAPSAEVPTQGPTLRVLDNDADRMAWQTGTAAADQVEEPDLPVRPAPNAFEGDTVGRAPQFVPLNAEENKPAEKDPQQTTFVFDGPFVKDSKKDLYQEPLDETPSAEGHPAPWDMSPVEEDLPTEEADEFPAEPTITDVPADEMLGLRMEPPALEEDAPAPDKQKSQPPVSRPGLRVRTVYPDGNWAKPVTPAAGTPPDSGNANLPPKLTPEPVHNDASRDNGGALPPDPVHPHDAALGDVEREEIIRRNEERRRRLRNMSMRLSDRNVEELENTPAYRRREIRLSDVPHSSEDGVSRYHLGEGGEGEFQKRNNSFLHDNVD